MDFTFGGIEASVKGNENVSQILYGVKRLPLLRSLFTFDTVVEYRMYVCLHISCRKHQSRYTTLTHPSVREQ